MILVVPKEHPQLSLGVEEGESILFPASRRNTLTGALLLPQADSEDPHPLLQLSLLFIDVEWGQDC